MSRTSDIQSQIQLATHGAELDSKYYSSYTDITDRDLVKKDRKSFGIAAGGVALAAVLTVVIPSVGWILGIVAFLAMAAWSSYRVSRTPELALNDALYTWMLARTKEPQMQKAIISSSDGVEHTLQEAKAKLSPEDRRNLALRRPVALEVATYATTDRRWEDTNQYHHYRYRHSRLARNLLKDDNFLEAFLALEQEEVAERAQWEQERLSNALVKKDAIIVHGTRTGLVSWIEPSATKRWLDNVDNALAL